MFLQILFSLYFSFTHADELVQVNVVWRHGDRTPLHCYPNDPYLSYWNQWPKGSLSTLGMSQVFRQGGKLKERYIDSLEFLSSNYNEEEIIVESDGMNRCIQSAASNMAGFYSGSKNTHPDDQGWPSQWTPVPIQTLSGLTAKLLDPGNNLDKNCTKNNILVGNRMQNQQFIDYQASFEPLFSNISYYAGSSLEETTSNAGYFPCLQAEKEFRNFTLPSWVTTDMYNSLSVYTSRVVDYVFGEADFGMATDYELFKLRGGPLFTEAINNMVAAQTGKNVYKMYAYSGHDRTLASLLNVVGAKQALLAHQNPEYGATLAFELWNSANGYYLKAMYSANVHSPFVPVTHLFNGCSGENDCLFSTFYAASRFYLVQNIEAECAAP